MEAITRLVQTTNTLTTYTSGKLIRGIHYISRFSIYPFTVRDDYNSAQCCMATLLYFLIRGNVEGFLFSKILSEQLLQMRSSYIKVWLLDDFKFDRADMMKAMNTLARMVANRKIYSFSPIVDIITCLEKKYNLEGYILKMVMELSAHSSTAKNTVSARCNNNEEHTSDGQETIQNLESVASTSTASRTTVEGPLTKVDSETFIGAVRSNNKNLVKELLSGNVSAQEKGEALALAAEVGYIDMVRMLVSSGADVGYKDSDGFTSLHRAAFFGKVGCLKVLLDVPGVDVDIKGGPDDRTALHYASWRGDFDSVEYLLGKGACVNSRGKSNKDTPLHDAAWGGHCSITEYLVASGADVNIVNSEDQTPLFYAQTNNNHRIAHFLESRASR